MGSERLRLKIGGALLAVLVLAMLVTATLSYLVYERTLSGLLVSRFDLIASELRGEIEASVDLGLPLGELDNVEQLMAKRKATDEQIVGITIFDARGQIVFDSDRTARGGRVAADWLQAVGAVPQGQMARAVERYSVATPLVNSFGKLTGGVIIRYSDAYLKAKLQAMLERLGEILLLAFAVSAFVATTGVLILTERLAYVYTRLETSVRLLSRRIGRPLDEPGLPRDLLASFLVLERDLDETVSRLTLGHGPADVPPQRGGGR